MGRKPPLRGPFTSSDRFGGNHLPDDSREADERRGERALRDLRARVKRARVVISQHPEIVEAIRRDWRKAAWFYALWGITGQQFREGIPGISADDLDCADHPA